MTWGASHGNIPYGKIMNGPVGDVAALGRLVRQVRRDMGVTQTELAGLANVGARFVVELERGKPTAEVGKVLRVLDRLGLRLFVALPGEGDER